MNLATTALHVETDSCPFAAVSGCVSNPINCFMYYSFFLFNKNREVTVLVGVYEVSTALSVPASVSSKALHSISHNSLYLRVYGIMMQCLLCLVDPDQNLVIVSHHFEHFWEQAIRIHSTWKQFSGGVEDANCNTGKKRQLKEHTTIRSNLRVLTIKDNHQQNENNTKTFSRNVFGSLNS